MRTWTCLLLSLLLPTPGVRAQTLVADVDTTPPDAPASSQPADFVPLVSGELLFVAETLAAGRELHRSDGTSGGTSLAVDVVPGPRSSDPRDLTPLASGTILFTASTDGSGRELWRTDGTPGGTQLVLEIRPGASGSAPEKLTAIGNRAVFFANDGTHGLEPWVSDGTAAGTLLLADTIPGPRPTGPGLLVQRIGRLATAEVLFGTAQPPRLWRSDGTPAGTLVVNGLPAPLYPSPVAFASVGGRTVFLLRLGGLDSPFHLWTTDGTAAGTFGLGVEGDGEFTTLGGFAYFAGRDADGQLELFRTDGTAGGTTQVADVTPAWVGGPSSPPCRVLGAVGSRVVFQASDNGLERDLWTTDGTPGGTAFLAEVEFSDGIGREVPRLADGSLLFDGLAGGTSGLWRTDGTAAGTGPVATVNLGFAASGALGNVLLFKGIDAVSGNELWRTDGTLAGTQLVADLRPTAVSLGSNPSLLLRHRDRVLFLADDGLHGREPWISDGTAAGTQLLLDLSPGSSSTSQLPVYSNERSLLFLEPGLSSITQEDPWISDGTPAGTTPLGLNSTLGLVLADRWDVVPFRDGFVFGARVGLDTEPWFTDGTLAGTRRIADVRPGTSGSAPIEFAVWRDRLFFVANSGGPEGRELWTSDGTAAGTTLLADTVPGSDGFSTSAHVEFHPFDGRLYFQGPDGELWSTDGTTAGTSLAVDLEPGPVEADPRNFAVVAGRLTFQATVGGSRRLTSIDGTAAGTVSLPSVPGGLGTLAAAGDATGFAVASGGGGYLRAYVTDVTTSIVPLDPIAYVPPGWWSDEVVDDHLLLALDDGITGEEPWVTDGTLAGTRQLFDLAPGSAAPRDFLRVGGRVFFAADDAVHGRELFSFPVTLVGDESVRRFGDGCPGASGLSPELGIDGEPTATGVQPFELAVTGADPSAPVVLAWSVTEGSFAFGGCPLWLGGTPAIATTVTDPAGGAAFAFTPNAALAGRRFLAQAFVLGTGALSATAGLEVIVGP